MPAASWFWSVARSSRWSAAGSPMATSRSSTKSPKPCVASCARAARAPSNVALALPPSAVITKKIVLPGGMSEQELEIQVESEANQYIPFSLDEVSLDFCVIGQSANSAGDVEVLIAASRKEKVQDRQGLAEAAGLKADDSRRRILCLAAGDGAADRAAARPGPGRRGRAVRDRRLHDQHAGACATRKCCTTAIRPSVARSSRS